MGRPAHAALRRSVLGYNRYRPDQPVYHERMTQLRTSDLTNAVGVHLNTVRRYGERGFLPPVERSPSGGYVRTRNAPGL